MSVRLRAATMQDVALLTYWDSQPHVVAATGDDAPGDWAEELSVDPDWRWYLVAEDDDRPVGLVQIIDPREEESHYWGESEPGLRAIDIWIGEQSDLGHGLGTQMMSQALDLCFAHPDVIAVVIDPLATNIRARRFYERMGFEAVGPRRFGTDDCLVYRLDRPAWQLHSGPHD